MYESRCLTLTKQSWKNRRMSPAMMPLLASRTASLTMFSAR